MSNQERNLDQISILTRLPYFDSDGCKGPSLRDSPCGLVRVTLNKNSGKGILGFRPAQRHQRDCGAHMASSWDARLTGAFSVELILVLPRIGLQFDMTLENYPINTNLGLRSVDNQRDGTYQVVTGSLAIGIPYDKAKELDGLWPADHGDSINCLFVEESGIFLQGMLQKEFYGDPQNQKCVRLLIPGRQEDENAAFELHKRIWPDSSNFSNLWEDGSCQFWIITSYPYVDPHEESAIPMNSVSFMKDYSDFFKNGLKDKLAPYKTFLENVECNATRKCRLYVFSESEKVRWIVTDPDTDLFLGVTGGVEACFRPAYFIGTLTPKSGSDWNRSVEFLSLPTNTDSKSVSNKKLDIEISVSRDSGVSPSVLKQTFQAFCLPHFPVKGELVSNDAKPPYERHRSWLCTSTGWMAIHASEKTYQLTKPISQGPVSGVIDFRELIEGPETDKTGKMTVQAQALNQSIVKLIWDEQEALILKIYESMLMVITPPVWLSEAYVTSAGIPKDEGGAFPSLKGPEGPEPDSYASLKWLAAADNALKKSLVRASFIHFPGDNIPDASGPLFAKVSYEEKRFQFAIENREITVWNRPKNFPVVQSYPVWPERKTDTAKGADSSETGVLLDSNRGLIPYSYSRKADRPVTLFFPASSLPFYQPSVKDMDSNADWELATNMIQTRYFLPALPGVELNLQSGTPKWIYRHGIPVLDESYAEVKEDPADTNSTSGKVGSMDFTRVVGTEAFEIKSNSKDTNALGWLHKTTKNEEGGLPITIEDCALDGGCGRNPRFSIVVNSKKATFDRLTSSKGMNCSLSIPTPATDSGKLPEFEVNFDKFLLENGDDPESDVTEKRFSIRHNGQPIISHLDPEFGICVMDGEGVVQSEPSKDVARYRRLNDKKDRSSWTRNLKLHLVAKPSVAAQADSQKHSKWNLTLIGITPDEDSEFSGDDRAYHESWSLNDESGDWPHLCGFPIYPLSMKIEENTLMLGAILLVTSPSEYPPAIPRNVGGRVTLSFGLDGTDWWMSNITGSIDWRFGSRVEPSEFPVVARIQAILKPKELDSEALMIESTDITLTVDHPFGLMELRSDKESESSPCQIQAGRLVFNVNNVKQSHPPFTYLAYGQVDHSTAETAVREDKEPVCPIPKFNFTWAPPAVSKKNSVLDGVSASAEISSSLICEKAENSESVAWKFETKLEKEGHDSLNISVNLNRNRISKSKHIFFANGIPADKGTWLKRDKDLPDIGFVGAEIGQSANSFPFLKELAADLRLRFTSNLVESEGTKLSVRLKLDLLKSASSAEQSVFFEVTGELSLRNSIVFEAEPEWVLEGGKKCEHKVTFFLNRAIIHAADMLRILYGLGPVDKLTVAGIAKHVLTFGNKDPIEWQAVQTIRFTDVVSFKKEFLDRPEIILFDPGNYEPLSDSHKKTNAETIERVAKILADPNITVSIEGHADIESKDTPDDNLEISTKRAQEILGLLKEKVHAPDIADRLIVKSWGDTRPVVPNDREHGDELNRRVELFFEPDVSVLFESNQSEFDVSGENNLVLRYVHGRLEAVDSRVIIIGHTDDIGDSEKNRELSKQRATSVRNKLVGLGADESKITCKWLGEDAPVVSNDTDEGKLLNRRAEILIRRASDEKLVIEAGAVFWLKPIPQGLVAKKGLADILNSVIKKHLSPREIGRHERSNGEGASRVIRLPFAYLRHSDAGLTAKIYLICGSGEAERLYGSSGEQLPINPPLISLDYKGQEVDFSYRSQNSLWSESEYVLDVICGYKTKMSASLKNKGDLLPAYLVEHGAPTVLLPSVALPDELSDLQPLLDANLTEKELAAATLITPYDIGWTNNGPAGALFQSALLEFPFTLENVTTALDDKSEHEMDLQLITFQNGEFRRIAHESIKIHKGMDSAEADTYAAAWGVDTLRLLGAREGAVALRDYGYPELPGSALLLIPQPFEIMREELTNLPRWNLDYTTYTSDNKKEFQSSDYGDQSPRCRLPRLSDGNKPDSWVQPEADADLNMLLFDALPQIPPDKAVKSVAATRFRLAPCIGGDQFRSQLRPARPWKTVDPGKSREKTSYNAPSVYSVTKWEKVSFEACVAPDTLKKYSAVNPRIIQDRIFVPVPENIYNKTGDIKETSVLPPMVDVVSWATRPGETVTSLWTANRHDELPEPNGELVKRIAGGQGVSVSLRRPRSVAGSDEEVRLHLLENCSGKILNDQFYYARFRMTAVVGKTEAPGENQIYGVVAGKNRFHKFSDSQNHVDTPRAFFYCRGTKPEPLNLYLLAYDNYDTQSEPGSITCFLLCDNAKEAPKIFKNGKINEDFLRVRLDDLPDQPELGFRGPQFDLGNPDSPWEKLDVDSRVYVYGGKETNKVSLMANFERALTHWLREEKKDIYLNRVVYKDEAQPQVHPLLLLKPLEKGSAIKAPKMGVAVLGRKGGFSPTFLSGYGRLDDDDFSPIKPEMERKKLAAKPPAARAESANSASPDRRIEWLRVAGLQTMDRIGSDQSGLKSEGDAANSKHPFNYDVLLYGSGGELITTTDPAIPDSMK